MKNLETTERTDIELLASRIELLFGFCAEMLQDIDVLEKMLAGTKERASYANSAAPILGAMGQDFEQISFDWDLKAKRAKALVDLLTVLRDTENERIGRRVKSVKNREAARDVMQYLSIK